MKKILVIEDHSDIRENTAELLDLEGYVVLSANNGVLGIMLAKREMPDIIICDVRMDELDGYGVLHQVQECEELRKVPVIFLTAMAESADRRKAFEMGAHDYITKPFEASILLKTIEKHLSMSHASNAKST